MKILVVGAGASFSTKDVEIGYLSAFRELGHEAHFYALDLRLDVANKWLKYWWRHGLDSDPAKKPGWPDTVYRASIEALEMALRYNVNWVFIVSGMYFHPDAIVLMRRAGLFVSVLLTESPYQDKDQAKLAPLANILFTNERTSVAKLKEKNDWVFYVKHAAPLTNASGRMAGVQADILPEVVLQRQAMESEMPELDVVFVGTGFQERIEILESVHWKDAGIKLGLYGTWSLLSKKSPLREFVMDGPIQNWATLALYRRAKIGLNLYRSSESYNVKSAHVFGAESLNPRAYELASQSTFCLTDGRAEGEELFGWSQPTIPNDSWEDYILYYLQNEEERKRLAAEANRAVQGHTYLERAREVANILEGSVTWDVS